MTFLEAAYKILKENKKPLHSKEIFRIALKRKMIETKGKSPVLTMNAQLLRDIKSKGVKSKFIKVGPSIFAINSNYKEYIEKGKKQKTKKERKILSEEFVKNSIIKWLSQNSWKILEISDLSGHGVDIKARKGNCYFIIETKGESESKQGNEVRFVYGLGQIITRMKVVSARYAYNYALGVPFSVAKIALRRIPWQFSQKVCLYILSVNKDGLVKKYFWQDLKRAQEARPSKKLRGL